MNTVYVITKLSGIQGFQNRKIQSDGEPTRLCCCLFCGDRLTEVNIDREGHSLLGSIYVGKVKNILKSIDAAFVEIAGGRTCFLPLAQARSPVLTNRAADGRFLVGDEILVQVQKDAVKTKDPVLTAKLSLNGKYVSLSLDGSPADKRPQNNVPQDGASADGQGVIRYSRKLSEDFCRQLADELDDQKLPAGMTAVIRTRAQELSDFAPLRREIETLSGQLARLLQNGRTRTVFSLLTETVPEYVKRLQSLHTFPDKIVTDELSVFQTLKSYLQKEAPDKSGVVSFYEDKKLSLSALYGLGGRLSEAFAKNVWLKSGGYLVIEPTEALTVIDVNSGKYTGKKGSAQTFSLINEEAAEEVARQLRLRNLSGIILVDFINMERAEENRRLLAQLKELCREDPVPVQVVDITALGLVEITRKKVSRPLAEQMEDAGASFRHQTGR